MMQNFLLCNKTFFKNFGVFLTFFCPKKKYLPQKNYLNPENFQKKIKENKTLLYSSFYKYRIRVASLGRRVLIANDDSWG